MCDVELWQWQYPETTMQRIVNIPNDETLGIKSSNAFMKGFVVLGGLFLAAYSVLANIFNRRNCLVFRGKRNKKNHEEEFQRQLALEREK